MAESNHEIKSCVSSPVSDSADDSFPSSNEDDVDEVEYQKKQPVSKPSCTNEPPTVLHWVRTSSLRVHDNPALYSAMKTSNLRFRAVYVIDPWFISEKRGKFGANRLRFLLEALHDLDSTLRTYNTRLHVVMGQPVAVIERLSREWNVSHITFQLDREPCSNVLEEAVQKLAMSLGIEVCKFCTQTLYNVEKVMNLGAIRTFRDIRDAFPILGFPEQPIPSPPLPEAAQTSKDDTSSQYNIPTMAELGCPSEELYTSDWIGGESEALRRLPVYCQLRSRPAQNMVDMLFDKSSLSPYIRFGCLSVRKFLWYLRDLKNNNPKADKLYKELFSKLLQREFYFLVSSQVPNFDSASNNAVCMPLPWKYDSSMVTFWKEGRTGYPWIDAAMRQLRKEGWIHNYLRESVACFLTRGNLWICWEYGKEVFEQLLLDYEPSVSCGCWIRSSCSGFITGPVEHYCPITFGQKIDPLGQFVRAYIPELRNMPSEYIYCPWTAPPEVQKASGCVLGVDYPFPVVDHTTVSTVCGEKLKYLMTCLQKASSHGTI